MARKEATLSQYNLFNTNYGFSSKLDKPRLKFPNTIICLMSSSHTLSLTQTTN